MAVGVDAQHGVTVGKGAPQRAPIAGSAPAGLVHVERPRRTDALEQIGVGIGQGVGDALQDRVDRPGANARAEQLLAALHDVAARNTVAHHSTATAASKRGPNALTATSAGSPARPPAA